MSTENLDWLADAMVRHLVRCARTYWTKEKPELEFWGLYEADIMTFLTRVFDGLGFFSWLEQSYPKPLSSRKVDLWAENPDGPDWLVEAKLVWGNEDLRMNIKRFHEVGEMLKDFKNLRRRFKEPFERLVVWVVVAKTGEERKRRKGAKTYTFFDAVQAAGKCAGATLRATRKVHVERYCNCPKWKYAHLYFWTVAPSPST